MCGRFVVAGSEQDLIDLFDVDEVTGEVLPPSWNVAPTDTVRLIRERPTSDSSKSVRQLVTARWGLVPPWSKDPKKGPPLINARAETILEKPSFRKAASRRRGIIVADGYYEWQKNPDGSKTPTYLHAEDDGMLAFAALYEYWPDPALPEDHPDKWMRSCTIITTSAEDTLGEIHDRTPIIVPKDLNADWLSSAITGKTEVRELLDAMPEPSLVPRIVGDAVGSVRNNGPELIEPVLN